MSLLLDTQTLIWWREGSRKLGPRARAAIESDADAVRVSAATAWEIAIKWRTGRLKLPEAPHRWVPAALASSVFDELLVSVEHAVAVAALPDHHPDPFDRLLIAQARIEGLRIVTSDAAFASYDVPLLDARA